MWGGLRGLEPLRVIETNLNAGRRKRRRDQLNHDVHIDLLRPFRNAT
jgi:hypothetical protein